MRTQFPREWEKLEYRSARDYLVNVAPLRAELAASGTDDRIANLRTNKLKAMRELWEACLFAHGVGTCVLGTEVYVARVENQDYDCVTQFIVNDTRYYAPVQIKELVPEHVNAAASLQNEIDKLEKYRSSDDLVVAVHMNRQFHFELDKLRIPELTIGELWLFGSVTPDTSRLMLWGNLLKNPSSHQYEYPEPNKPLQPIAREDARSG
jgi:hypothetical protein